MPTKTPTKTTAPPTTSPTAAEDAAAMKLAVKINSIRSGQNPVAFASVNLGGCFAVHNIKIMDGSKGLFVNMPSYKDGKGEYRDICFPITKEFRERMYGEILTAYEQAMQTSQTAEQKQDAPDYGSEQPAEGMKM